MRYQCHIRRRDREIRVSSLVDHPNVLRLLGVCSITTLMDDSVSLDGNMEELGLVFYYCSGSSIDEYARGLPRLRRMQLVSDFRWSYVVYTFHLASSFSLRRPQPDFIICTRAISHMLILKEWDSTYYFFDLLIIVNLISLISLSTILVSESQISASPGSCRKKASPLALHFSRLAGHLSKWCRPVHTM